MALALQIVLMLLLICCSTVHASAQVDIQHGRLALDLAWTPETAQSESVEYLLDFASNLQLSLTFSGLSASSDVGWGVTGLEFAILRLQGVLGVFDLHDEFVFAAPFGLHNQSLAQGRVSSVKKRVSVRFNLYGLEVENLALFENVKFTHPFFDDAEALDLALGLSRLGVSLQFTRPAAGKTVALSNVHVSWSGQVAFVQVDADVRWSVSGLRAANLAVALDF